MGRSSSDEASCHNLRGHTSEYGPNNRSAFADDFEERIPDVAVHGVASSLVTDGLQSRIEVVKVSYLPQTSTRLIAIVKHYHGCDGI